MLVLMAKYWWVALLRGIAAILFGLMAFIWPGLTLATLVLFFGAWALVSGVFLVVGALGGRAPGGHWGWMLLEGLLGIAVGIMTYVSPGITEVALLLYISAWCFAMGVVEIVAAIRLRKEIEGEGWLILSGLLSVAFALALLLWPASGALALMWMIGGFALVFGALAVALAFKLRGLKDKLQVPGRPSLVTP